MNGEGWEDREGANGEAKGRWSRKRGKEEAEARGKEGEKREIVRRWKKEKKGETEGDDSGRKEEDREKVE